MSDQKPRPHNHRVMQLAVDALRARRRLPHRDPLAVTAAWLRPNWPDMFILAAHRARVVRLLMEDADLRAEVAKKLGSGGLSDADLPRDADTMRRVLNAAADPEQMLQSVAVNPDAAVAILSEPYLMGSMQVPARPVPPPRSSSSRPDTQPTEVHRELRQAHAIRRRLEADLRAAQGESEHLRTQLTNAEEELAAANSKAAQLQGQLPTRKQQRALDAATELAAKLRRTQRALDKARTARAKELQQARQQTVALERKLKLVQQELEGERRGRRRLTDELGDASARARRLLPFVERTATETREQAAAERPSQERSRHVRRAEDWEQLATLLAKLYGLNGPAESTHLVSDGEPASAIRLPPTQITEQSLRVTALGGSNHIGGSALLVEVGDTRILVDAGLRPQAHASHPGPPRINEAVQRRLDGIIITHAHADHAGYVPWVTEKQRAARIFCSPQTAALLPTVWADSVRVMRAEADSASSYGVESVEPPYGDAEVSHSEDALVPLPYGRGWRVGAVEITLFQAGHILGAAGVVIQADDRRVVITGDIDDRAQTSVAAAQIPPRLAHGADLLVIETTYCDSIHNDRQQEGSSLVAEAGGILDSGGRILIPAFGLGRAQEIALLLGEQMPTIDVLVDGLARDISELYARQGAPEVLRGRVRKVVNREREILGFHTGIVITTSGMLTGGAAVPWAEAVLQEPLSALFLCGHQDEDSPGKELELLANADPDSPRDVRLRGATGQATTINVAAKVLRYNLSAHADRAGLASIIDQVDPQAIMLVHGEPAPQRVFQGALERRGRVVVDNQQTWDSEAPLTDPRRPHQRHGSRSGSGRGRRS